MEQCLDREKAHLKFKKKYNLHNAIDIVDYLENHGKIISGNDGQGVFEVWLLDNRTTVHVAQGPKVIRFYTELIQDLKEV